LDGKESLVFIIIFYLYLYGNLGGVPRRRSNWSSFQEIHVSRPYLTDGRLLRFVSLPWKRHQLLRFEVSFEWKSADDPVFRRDRLEKRTTNVLVFSIFR